MQIQRMVTHIGTGCWWNDSKDGHDLALVNERRVYHNTAGTREESVWVYFLVSRKSGQEWTWRRFDTEADRQEFVDARLGSYDLCGPVKGAETAAWRVYHPAQDLTESKVWSVSLIGDQLTLELDAGRLEFLRWPLVLDGDGVHRPGDPGYRKVLSGLVERCITDLDECLDAGLVVRFVGGTALHVSLGYDGSGARPEAALFHSPDGRIYTWRGGEVPFAARELG